MNKRKFLGTIIGLIFWSFCVIFFTYAYYDWKSDPTNVVLGIEDLSVECVVGANVSATNIGPVLDYRDGVKAEISIKNTMADNMAIELRLDITSISDNLLTDSLKYVLVADTTGGTNYDYNNPIIEGNFSNFNIGNNTITKALEVTSEITSNYQFIIYIDGNMYNNPNMQQNNLAANLLVGNCGEDAIPMNEMAYQAIYSETDKSLTFIYNKKLKEGDTYNDKQVTKVYTGFETANYYNDTQVPWNSVRTNIETVSVEDSIKPKNIAYWFMGFSNLKNIDLKKMDTKDVTSMVGMFAGCSSLIELDLSNFNTSNVTRMGDWDGGGMFQNCSNLKSLDISNFDTSKVEMMMGVFKGCSSLTSLDISNFDIRNVIQMPYMFEACSSLTSLDLGNFDTSKVKRMEGMFSGCIKLIDLDVSNFDTSNVTTMYMMFYNCSSLTSLNLSNFDTRKVTNMGLMFMKCSSLTELDLSNFNTSNVVGDKWSGFCEMFSECTSLTSLDISNFDTSKVKSMLRMFNGCTKLIDLDVSNFDTSNVIYMIGMFNNCQNLINLDVSSFNTAKVIDMEQMFNKCNKLINLDISNFDTSSVTNMKNMFSSCYALETLNLGEFDTSSVISMNEMFAVCWNITATLTIRNSNITNYTNIFNQASTNSNAKIIVNYTPETSSLVDAMIATKSSNSNVVKGSCIGDNCPA